MNYLRREIKTRRILVKPSFQDFDRINVLHVTYEQFTRALTKLGLTMPAICFKILARKYMDKNNTRDINYDRFLKEVDYEHVKGGLGRPGVQASQGLASSGMQSSQVRPGDLNQPSHLGFDSEEVHGTNLAPGLNGQTLRRGPDGQGANTYNISLAENQAKGRFDNQSQLQPTDAEHENAKNKDKLTALGNSQLKVD